jgi:hypothetical protein
VSGIGILLIAFTIVAGLAAQVASGFVKFLLLGMALVATVVLLAMVARKLYRNSRAQ